MRDRTTPIAIGILMTVMGVALVFLVVLAFQSAARYEKACEALGGSTRTEVSHGYGYSSDGKYVPTTNTRTYCVSPDGRLLFP